MKKLRKAFSSAGRAIWANSKDGEDGRAKAKPEGISRKVRISGNCLRDRCHSCYNMGCTHACHALRLNNPDPGFGAKLLGPNGRCSRCWDNVHFECSNPTCHCPKCHSRKKSALDKE